MKLDADACYRALAARDERFDGLFFVAVKTTGIYCRPICRARTPGADRCVFFRSAAEAEHDGFRACFRCRPELSPGSAPVDSVSRIVAAAMARIELGTLNDGTVDDLARGLGVTGRHLRRAMQAELGISPVELAQSRRLAMARQLLFDTSLPVTNIAFASGFQSVRRFNALFRTTYGRAPSELRHTRNGSRAAGTVTLTLDYRPPYAWDSILGFLGARAIPGVELVRDGVYRRTVRMGNRRGWVAISRAKGRAALQAEVSISLAEALIPLVGRLRRLFDLDAHPKTILAHLEQDPKLAQFLQTRPGLRVPGALCGFEAAIRAIVGQQVSVVAATTLAGRLAGALGEPIETPYSELTRLSPIPEHVGAAPQEALVSLGILASRARSLRALAQAVATDALSLEPGAGAERVLEQLLELPGIGTWTAHYVAMRALGWPDAFPESDLGIRKALGGISAQGARVLAERWRPWRSYAVMHLWTSLSGESNDRTGVFQHDGQPRGTLDAHGP